MNVVEVSMYTVVAVNALDSSPGGIPRGSIYRGG
jgi:hypothetical protein